MTFKEPKGFWRGARVSRPTASRSPAKGNRASKRARWNKSKETSK